MITLIVIATIRMACNRLNLQTFINPSPVNPHFHGSVKIKNQGIHATSKVAPKDKAKILKNCRKGACFPKNMVMKINASEAEIRHIPSALTRCIKNMVQGLAGAMLKKLAPE